MPDSPLADRVRGVAALDHPVTRSVYRLLAERGEVGRDAASEALGLARSVAAFHLDKLVEAGLADVRFARLTGRSGPGAGRPAKLYRRSDTEIGVSLPERRYDLAAGVLAEAVERSTTAGVSLDRALRQSAAEAGRHIATAAGAPGSAGGPISAEGEGEGEHAPVPSSGADQAEDAGVDRARRHDALVALLERCGYEPHREGDEIVLANCPFHALAERHRDLVCGMNLQLLGGVIEGSGDVDVVEARLAPEPGRCCVRLTTR